MKADLIVGDCRAVLATLPENSVDAICADPPYGLGFMGHEWDQPGMEGQKDGKQIRSDHPAMEAGRYDLAPKANRAYQRWCEEWGAAALRVAKPGAHMLSFGGTRTVHRLTSGLEDAGWEIRDVLVWGYAEGFPKNLNVPRSIDMHLCTLPGRHCMHRLPPEERRKPNDHVCPRTPAGAEHAHEGTALKPAWEPIVLARKPISGTIAETVLALGTGVLNIEGTRLAIDPDDPVNDAVWTSQPSAFRDGTAGFVTSNAPGDRIPTRPKGGRWPANVMLTDPIFDGDMVGVIGGGASDGGIAIRRNGNQRSNAVALGQGLGEWPVGTPDFGYGDRGTYSRFFLIPEDDRRCQFCGALSASATSSDAETTATRSDTTRDRWTCASCADLITALGTTPAGRHEYPRFLIISKADKGQREPLLPVPPVQRGGSETFDADVRDGVGKDRMPQRQNTHPTVKPIDLMRHLVRLVTPAGGTVLDPFLGSGTTAMAAEMEGLGWIGIERDPDYAKIAHARLLHIERGLGLDVEAPRPSPKRSNGRPWPDKRQPHGIMGSTHPTTGQMFDED